MNNILATSFVLSFRLVSSLYNMLHFAMRPIEVVLSVSCSDEILDGVDGKGRCDSRQLLVETFYASDRSLQK